MRSWSPSQMRQATVFELSPMLLALPLLLFDLLFQGSLLASLQGSPGVVVSLTSTVSRLEELVVVVDVAAAVEDHLTLGLVDERVAR